MPVIMSSNNRVLPNNSRSVDVARNTVDRILPIQARRYDAAFRVEGYRGILYNGLTSGVRCACKNPDTQLKAQLDGNGKADPGMLNSLLTGGLDFGVRPYQQLAAADPDYRVKYLEVGKGAVREQLPAVPSLYDTDRPAVTAYQTIYGTYTDRYDKDGDNSGTGTIIRDGEGIRGPIGLDADLDDLVANYGSDNTLIGATDASCPICFGNSFVGGYGLYNGFRKVLVPNGTEAQLPPAGFIDFSGVYPRATSLSCTWVVTFPVGCEFVDSVTLFNGDSSIGWASFTVDAQTILTPLQMKNFCDGRPHTVTVNFVEDTTFSHLEIQFGTSKESPCFELPKRTKSSIRTLLDSTDPFTVVLSPMIPLVQVQDIIVEGTSNSVLSVKSVTGWNDRTAAVLGWEVEVRVVQPQELATILPRRRELETSNRHAYVRDNITGNRRT